MFGEAGFRLPECNLPESAAPPTHWTTVHCRLQGPRPATEMCRILAFAAAQQMPSHCLVPHTPGLTARLLAAPSHAH
jgi:hypothetical protein